MASASIDGSGGMETHSISTSNPLPPAVIEQLISSGILDEISNYPGAVRHHIYGFSDRNKNDNTLRFPMLFFIYQTTRYGPQNGFRLCLVHDGFHIDSGIKSEDGLEDDIDCLEKEIPQGLMEFVILGPKRPPPPCESPPREYEEEEIEV